MKIPAGFLHMHGARLICIFTPLWAVAHLPRKGGDQPSWLFLTIFGVENSAKSLMSM
jgi:hypothetical protein